MNCRTGALAASAVALVLAGCGPFAETGADAGAEGPDAAEEAGPDAGADAGVTLCHAAVADAGTECQVLAKEWRCEVADVNRDCHGPDDCAMVGQPSNFCYVCQVSLGSCGIAVAKAGYASSRAKALAQQFDAKRCSDQPGLQQICDCAPYKPKCEAGRCAVDWGSASCWR